MSIDFDIIINGAGPSGLCFAKMASQMGLKIAIIEIQSHDAIKNPKFDGRDIALTHRSRAILQDLGVWQKFNQDNISTIDGAKVHNGKNAGLMGLDTHAQENLAFVVSNHLVRDYAFQVVANDPNIQIFFENSIKDIKSAPNITHITLADNTNLSTKLLIAADSRFSTIRKKFGISASMYDFGKTMVVCRMKHELPHNNIANECFHEGHTMAMLPLVGDVSSAVITMKPNQIDELMALSVEEFNNWVANNYDNKLGKMELISERFAYPLVGVYANDFIAPRFALIGDAAVGMHPVTAHGFNFGLLSIATLAHEINKAQKRNSDIGAPNILAAYARKHRFDTLPLYVATKGIVKLYTNDSPPALIARRALINLADKMAPIKAIMMNKLVDDGSGFLGIGNFPFAPPLPKLPKLPKIFERAS